MAKPKIFVSSVVHGLEAERDVAARVIASLDCHTIRCEDFGAQPIAPRTACEQAVDAADAMIALFSSRWGFVPPDANPSKLSATALEVERARNQGKPVLLFLRKTNPSDVEAELRQYIEQLTSFSTGLTFAGFRSIADLEIRVRASILGLFHRYLLASVAPTVVSRPPSAFQDSPNANAPMHPSGGFHSTVTNYGGAVAVSQFGNSTAIQYGSAAGQNNKAAPTTNPDIEKLQTMLKELQNSTNASLDFQNTIGEVDAKIKDLILITQGIKSQLDYMWSDIEQAGTKSDLNELLRKIAESVGQQPAPATGKAGKTLAMDIATGVLGNSAYDLLSKILLPLILQAAH